MGFATLKAQAELKELRRAAKPAKVIRDRNPEDPRMMAAAYLNDAAKALAKAHEYLGRTSHKVTQAQVKTLETTAAATALLLKESVPRTRRTR